MADGSASSTSQPTEGRREPPEATVVIPTRNRVELLARLALRAALAQELVDLEVVVVDDGSSDGTVERLAAIGDPRLRVVSNTRGAGVAQARNTGIDEARGDWIAFLDDDDVWAPEKLRRQLDVAAASGAGMAYSGAVWLDERLVAQRVLEPTDPATLARDLLRWNVVWAGCSNVIARRSVLVDLGGFDEDLFQLADWDLWIRLALATPAAAIAAPLVGYVMQPGSMLLTDRRDVFLEFDRLRAKHARAAFDHGVAADEARFARWVALGHLRAGRRRAAARTYLERGVRTGDLGALPRAVGALAGPRAIAPGRALLAALRRQEHVVELAELPWLARYR